MYVCVCVCVCGVRGIQSCLCSIFEVLCSHFYLVSTLCSQLSVKYRAVEMAATELLSLLLSIRGFALVLKCLWTQPVRDLIPSSLMGRDNDCTPALTSCDLIHPDPDLPEKADEKGPSSITETNKLISNWISTSCQPQSVTSGRPRPTIRPIAWATAWTKKLLRDVWLGAAGEIMGYSERADIIRN